MTQLAIHFYTIGNKTFIKSYLNIGTIMPMATRLPFYHRIIQKIRYWFKHLP